MKQNQVFIVVVGQTLAVLVDRASKDSVGPGIAGCAHLPVPHDKFMAALGGSHGIEHDG